MTWCSNLKHSEKPRLVRGFFVSVGFVCPKKISAYKKPLLSKFMPDGLALSLLGLIKVLIKDSFHLFNFEKCKET